MFKFKILLVLVIFASSLFANEVLLNQSQVYFLPKQADEAKDKIVDLINNSKNSIKISMYNFSYKKFAKELADASKKGVKIQVI